jgi:hypothetical protein
MEEMSGRAGKHEQLSNESESSLLSGLDASAMSGGSHRNRPSTDSAPPDRAAVAMYHAAETGRPR